MAELKDNEKVVFTCESCGATLQSKNKKDIRARCPKCRNWVYIPAE